MTHRSLQSIHCHTSTATVTIPKVKLILLSLFKQQASQLQTVYYDSIVFMFSHICWHCPFTQAVDISCATAVYELRAMNHCQRQRANTLGILYLWLGSGPKTKQETLAERCLQRANTEQGNPHSVCLLPQDKLMVPAGQHNINTNVRQKSYTAAIWVIKKIIFSQSNTLWEDEIGMRSYDRHCSSAIKNHSDWTRTEVVQH